jgi:hypothetical protein
MKLFSKVMLALAALNLLLGIWSFVKGEFHSGVLGLSLSGFLLLAACWDTNERPVLSAWIWPALGVFFLTIACVDLATESFIAAVVSAFLAAVLLKSVRDDRRKPTSAGGSPGAASRALR